MGKNIIVIGHVDHGKTEFINAVSHIIGVESKRNEETCSTETSFSVKGNVYRIFDFAGDYQYEDGITGNEDMAILICALTDGPMPGAKKHLEICHKKGIKKLAVFFTKRDYVDDDFLADLVKDEVLDVISEYGFSTDIITEMGAPNRVNERDDENEIKKIKKFLVNIANQF